MSAPTKKGTISVEIDTGAFSIPASGKVTAESTAKVSAPTGTLSATVEDGLKKLYVDTPINGEKIKLSISDGTLKFKSDANTSDFAVGDNLNITNVSVDAASNTATLTLSGTPKTQGTLTITAQTNAFEYAPDGPAPTANVTVEAAPVVTLNLTSIVAGTTNEVKITIGSGDANFASAVTPSTLTVGGDEFSGLTVSEVTSEGKNATLTLSAVPDKTGNMTIIVPKNAFNPVASAAVTATIEVQAPSGPVNAALSGSPGTLTAGVEAGGTTIQLTSSGSVNFTNDPSNGYFTLENDTGEIGTLAVSGATGSGKTVTLSLTGIPQKQGTFKVKIDQAAFVASPGEDLTATGQLNIEYPTISLEADPNHIAEEDDSVHSIKIKASGGTFKEVSGESDNFSFSTNIVGIKLTGVTAGEGSTEAVLAFSGMPESTGELTITVQPSAFQYRPEDPVTAQVKIGKPEGEVSATAGGSALYNGTPVTDQTVVLNITVSHGLHFKESGYTPSSDFTLTGDYTGLSIKEVTYNSASKVTLTLQGTPSVTGSFGLLRCPGQHLGF